MEITWAVFRARAGQTGSLVSLLELGSQILQDGHLVSVLHKEL